jgi:DNA replication and repair protein RecF
VAVASPAPWASPQPVSLSLVELHDFRSYADAALTPDPALTVVAAPNGAGKTNLLEAVFVAITGRSHRAAVEGELVRTGAAFARVRLHLLPRGSIELVLPGTDPPPGLRKRWMVNGVPRRASTVGETARAVLFRPEEMLLLVGSPGERRRFLDAILAQRSRRSARDLTELSRVLAQRNALLRAIRAEEASIDSLGFWDEQLAVVGAHLMAARLSLVGELRERIGPLHEAVAAGDELGASVELRYVDTLKEAWSDRPEPPEAAEVDLDELTAAFRRRIADVRQKEAWNGVSLVGPQRDDMRAELAGHDVATHASRGQQRTIILALKLAETALLSVDGPRPIVLLDDVFSELDPQRAERLSILLAHRGQVILTTADPGTLGPLRRTDAPIWRIEGGELRAPGR